MWLPLLKTINFRHICMYVKIKKEYALLLCIDFNSHSILKD